MQLSKINDVFGASLRKRRIENLIDMIMKWNWVLWLNMVMWRTKSFVTWF